MRAYTHVKKSLQVVYAKPKELNVRCKIYNKTSYHSLSSQSYRPELETTKGCNDDKIQFYHILVGIMRWLWKIDRIYILTYTSVLLIYLLESRVRNMHQALHLFKYLKGHKCSKCVFDPNYVDITNNHMPVKERENYREKVMNELYPDSMDYLHLNAPNIKGQSSQISCFGDADHGGDQIGQRSRTGILILLKKAPVIRYSK